jgi:hypothetical protein
MSLSTFDTDQPFTPCPAEAPAPLAGRAHGNNSTSLSRLLGVVPGMLSSLDTLTAAGQHHVMSKIVTFLQDQATHATHRVSHGNQRAFAELLGHLTCESERLLPDVRAFSRRAEGVVALLATIT